MLRRSVDDVTAPSDLFSGTLAARLDGQISGHWPVLMPLTWLPTSPRRASMESAADKALEKVLSSLGQALATELIESPSPLTWFNWVQA